MTLQQLQNQIQRILSKEKLENYILLGIDQEYRKLSQDQIAQLEKNLNAYMTAYITTNSPLATITQENFAEKELSSIMPDLMIKLDQAEDVLSTEDIEYDIIFTIRKALIKGIKTEEKLLEQIKEENKAYIDRNKTKQCQIELLVTQLDHAKTKYEIQEEIEESLLLQSEADNAFINGDISEEYYDDLNRIENKKQIYYEQIITYLDTKLRYATILAECNIEFLTTGRNISEMIQLFKVSSQKMLWEKAEVDIKFAEFQYANRDITEEKKREIIGEALITQMECESKMDILDPNKIYRK